MEKMLKADGFRRRAVPERSLCHAGDAGRQEAVLVKGTEGVPGGRVY